MAKKVEGNCVNCGAKLEVTGGQIKCAYCGTVVTDDSEESRAKELDQIRGPITVPVNPVVDQRNSGCAPAIFVGLFLILIIAIFIYNSKKKGNTSAKYTDSLAVDTTTLRDSVKAKVPEETGQQRANKETLKELSSIVVDVKTFKKLYRNARKHKDQFASETYIYDKTSPDYVNMNGNFLYISADFKEDYYILRFKNQYFGNDWLFINQMIFNSDGENSTYSDMEFKRDNGDGSVWEWIDQDVPDVMISKMIKIATAKKVSLKYNGDKYYKVISITPKKQAAMKRQLQIFKGLLLGYQR